MNPWRVSALLVSAALLTMPAEPGADATASLVQLIRSQMMMCWSPPMKGHDIVVLIVRLNRDGTLAQPPQLDLAEPDATLPSPDETKAAMRAVESCAPYKLPADMYDRWKIQKLTFDPSAMLHDETDAGSDAHPK